MDEERRLKLHELLVEAAGEGIPVYFQEPSSVDMQYPCIRYERARTDTKFAGNIPYLLHGRYTVTVMDWDRKSPILPRVARLPRCTHDRYFAKDNLNHDVFDVYI